MANILQVNNLTKSYGERALFSDISFGVDEGDKIGIVAKNGTGKSTLLKIIAGDETPDNGDVIFRNGVKIGFLNQVPVFEPGVTAFRACFTGRSDILNAIEQYHKALDSGNTSSIDSTSHLMDVLGAWDYEQRLNQLLTQFGVDINAYVDNLSGGQRKRLALVKIIINNPDILILDEPTNHLDIGVIEWLEQYLSRQKITILLVTHDRYFLDSICNSILDLSSNGAFLYKGNFDNYLRRRDERITALESMVGKVKNTLRREQEWMNRQPQARAGKAKFRIDNFYKLKELSRTDLRDDNINLNIKSSYIGNKIAEAKSVTKSYPGKLILNDFSYTFARYEKIGIVGENGIGKSTFIKMMLGLVKPDKGEWVVGETVRFGYYSQDGIEFDGNKKVIDAVTEIAEDIVLFDGQRFSRMQFLKKFLFDPADQMKYIHSLSGGELCRLHLATVLMRSPNFLVLDEPTNDLDLVTLGLLSDFLQDYKGCAVIISHDRSFLDQIVDHLFIMEGNGVIKDFPGTYSDYRQWKLSHVKEEVVRTVPEITAGQKQKIKEPDKPKLTYKEKREFEVLSKEIDELTREKKDLDSLFASGKPLDNVEELSARYNVVSEELDVKEMRWLELSEKE